MLAVGKAAAVLHRTYEEVSALAAVDELLESFGVELDLLLSAVTAVSDRVARAEEQTALELDMRRNQLVLFDLRYERGFPGLSVGKKGIGGRSVNS